MKIRREERELVRQVLSGEHEASIEVLVNHENIAPSTETVPKPSLNKHAVVWIE